MIMTCHRCNAEVPRPCYVTPPLCDRCYEAAHRAIHPRLYAEKDRREKIGKGLKRYWEGRT